MRSLSTVRPLVHVTLVHVAHLCVALIRPPLFSTYCTVIRFSKNCSTQVFYLLESFSLHSAVVPGESKKKPLQYINTVLPSDHLLADLASSNGTSQEAINNFSVLQLYCATEPGSSSCGVQDDIRCHISFVLAIELRGASMCVLSKCDLSTCKDDQTRYCII